jgi:hypothetical protein
MPGLRPFSFSVGERKIMNHFVVNRSETDSNSKLLLATSATRGESARA